MKYKGIKLPNYFSPKWVNHSIYKGLMVVLNVRNMERNYKMFEATILQTTLFYGLLNTFSQIIRFSFNGIYNYIFSRKFFA